MQRAPIVVVLGHVDHGKTTLLDTLKKTQLAAHEAGGITQSIGAYQLLFKGKKLTFIDTPGHAAFSSMRAGGAKVADLALLVVAANDGVKPQTIEALETIRQASIPYIVVINKIDLPDADVVKVKTQLAEQQSSVEGFGGNIPVVEISAKEGTHLPELLEMVFLVYDLSDPIGTIDQSLEAPVIESRRAPGAGPLVSVVIRSGKISLGDHIIAGSIHGKIKALFDERGERVIEALPGDPIQILGFDDIIPVGTIVSKTSESSVQVPTPQQVPRQVVRTLPQQEKQKTFILKADSVGTLTALIQSMPSEIEIVSSAVGDISESDILMAESTKATIVGFRVKATKPALTLAEAHGVIIITNTIIYKLLESIADPTIRKSPMLELGRAKIIKVFDVSGQKIAGCKVISGRLTIGDTVQIDESPLEFVIKQLKKGKAEATTVKAGEECGVFIAPIGEDILKFTTGNDIIAFEKKKRESNS